MVHAARKTKSSLAYWFKAPSLEIMLLVHVRSHREGNFGMYVQSLAHIVPWSVAMFSVVVCPHP